MRFFDTVKGNEGQVYWRTLYRLIRRYPIRNRLQDLLDDPRMLAIFLLDSLSVLADRPIFYK